MFNASHFFFFAVLLGCPCSKASSAGKKQAIINVGGASNMQGGLLRTARQDADLDADLKKLMTPNSKSKGADANPDLSMSLIAKGPGSSNFDDDLKKLMNADADTDKQASTDKLAADTKASDKDPDPGSDPDMKDLMASLAQPSNTSAEASDNDPETDSALAGIDAQLKQESAMDNNTELVDPGPLKFKSLERLLGDLKTEQQENGDLDKSLKSLDNEGGTDDADQDKQTDASLASLSDSKDLEQSLADLNQIDQNSSLPNAASLLELEVDEGTNHRMSTILHRMSKMGAHIKHLTQRIDNLHKLHQASQNGVSLLQLSGDDGASKIVENLESSNKELDKEIAHVQKTWTDVSGSIPNPSLAQGKSSKTSSKADLTWIENQISNHGGAEKIDPVQDHKLMDEYLAKFEAKYGPMPA